MPTPRTMRAIAIDHFGGPEELTVHEVEVPRAGPGEVLIKVKSAGVGVWDGAERAGQMQQMTPDGAKRFPRVLGADGAGTVAAVGEGARGFNEGDLVYGDNFLSPRGGFYAEYAAVPADHVAPVPRGVDVEQAGALAIPGVTALRGLSDTLDLKPSQRLLIFGASGGVGNAAVQLAKAIGAKVLAVVTTPEAATVAREAGADAVVNSKNDDLAAAIESFAPDGLDAAQAHRALADHHVGRMILTT